MAAHTVVGADSSLRYTGMFLGHEATNQTTKTISTLKRFGAGIAQLATSELGLLSCGVRSCSEKDFSGRGDISLGVNVF